MKNSTLILQQLRLLMVNVTIFSQDNLSAYIIPSSDAHHNIRRADCDQRLAFISGFDGSSGTAIVTQNDALLWTDARYFIQAGQQIDENWTLMKEGLEETPSQTDWLNQNLPHGALIGIDPTLYSNSEWNQIVQNLNIRNITLIPIRNNLIDVVWGKERPDRPKNPITQLAIQFTGKTVEQKLLEIRENIQSADETLLISELDEIAWLLNLRGTDLPLAPTFFAFIILTNETIKLFVDKDKFTNSIVDDLITAAGGNVEFHNYGDIVDEFKKHVGNTTGWVWLSPNSNYGLTSAVPSYRQLIKLTPISLNKAVKNPTEISGIRQALIRDSAALCQFYAWLESAINIGENLTEVGVADKLLEIKRKQENFVSLSFKTISGSGSNGAIIHYFPTNVTDRKLSIDEMYLVDSGSHYLDGTTDITRTFHFGTPTRYQKDCYTRVLKGQIAIATSPFPIGTLGYEIDAFARRHLWKVGLDFGHGTGHGIGAYLNVGEGPQSINSQFNPDDPGLQENMITSNEPGYYEEGSFGIRLENVVRVARSNLTHGSDGEEFLQMEDLTFVPYQHKLIDIELLSKTEKTYINDYQVKCRDIIGNYILENGFGQDAYNWLMKETSPI